MSQRTDVSQAPRIAIKFGSGSSTPKPGISSKSQAPSKPSSKPSSTLGKRQRSHAFDHDSDSDEDDGFSGKHEAVTSFGMNGAENETRRKDSRSTDARNATTPFVIGGHKNRDWKSEVKARKTGRNVLPHEAQAEVGNGSLKETEPPDQEKQIKWGLTIPKKQSPEEEITTIPADGAKEQHDNSNDGTERERQSPGQPDDPDDDAMNALLGKKRKSARDFVIEGETPQVSEEDAYQRGYEEAAEVSTIEEYDAIPEGEFGAAMLRGMGWKGEERAPKPKLPTRRPHLMGLGAKEDEELKKAEMAKKHGHRERRPRLDEYRASKDNERRSREDRRPGSYKSERDRERQNTSHSHRNGDRDRDRDRDHHRDRNRDRDREWDRERDSNRNRDRHQRR